MKVVNNIIIIYELKTPISSLSGCYFCAISKVIQQPHRERKKDEEFDWKNKYITSTKCVKNIREGRIENSTLLIPEQG